MSAGIFVTGTDTGVGKTLVSAALVHYFARQGLKTAGLKPVSAGCVRADGGWLSEDVVQLRAAGNLILPPEVVNPYAFEPPLAPHIAATMAAVRIELDVIAAAYAEAARQADVLVVEGVGGFRVPLNDAEDTADMAVRLGLPVVLVVGMRLGCLNHALLTAESIAGRGLKLAGWVANGIDPDMDAQPENLSALHARLPASCLGVVSYQLGMGFQRVEAELDQSAMGDFVCANLPNLAKIPKMGY